MSSEGFYYNGTKLDNTSTNTFTNSLSATIFAIKQANNPTQVLNRNPVMKLYSCKIWENNVLVKNFIPCYRVSDNVIGMYDLVSNTFLTNAGTGTFTKGSNAPTPDTPIDIEVVTGTQEVKVTGNELVNLANETLNGMTITRTDNGYILNGTTTALTNFRGAISNPVSSSKTLIARCNTTITNANIQVKTRNSSAGQLRSLSMSTADTWQVTSGTYEDYYCDISIKSGVTLNNVLVQPMLLEGTFTASDIQKYQPYNQEQTQTISLGDIELCKIGNYQDYLYKSGDKWYKKENIYKKILNGSENWIKSNTRFHTAISSADGNYVIGALCREYIEVSTHDIHANTNYSFIVCNSGWGIDHCRISFNNSDYASVDSWKNALATNNIAVYYQLTNELGGANDIQITNTNLISQLDNLEKMYSYNGVTNISTNGNLPIVLGVSALKGES